MHKKAKVKKSCEIQPPIDGGGAGQWVSQG